MIKEEAPWLSEILDKVDRHKNPTKKAKDVFTIREIGNIHGSRVELYNNNGANPCDHKPDITIWPEGDHRVKIEINLGKIPNIKQQIIYEERQNEIEVFKRRTERMWGKTA